MKLTICVTGERDYEIESLPDEDCLALAADFESGEAQVLTFTMDEAIVKIARRHIVALELE